jgi:hypothetical protein
LLSYVQETVKAAMQESATEQHNSVTANKLADQSTCMQRNPGTHHSLLLLLLLLAHPPSLQGALGLSPQAEGSPATAYEGAVFSSDDPEYTQQQGSAGEPHQTV